VSAPRGGPPDDPLGAVVRDNHVALKGAAAGPLAGLTFAAKNVFGMLDNCPLGLLLVGRRGADEMLLEAAVRVMADRVTAAYC
jgi:Asp-tRNA(Asn)/Glu-tRNA(Gln) amidotransferase A subunit family amidase